MPSIYRVDPSALKSVCDASRFDFKNTAEVKILETVIGQKRAISAIEFGLNMKSPGYNIFVTGSEGTGKSTIVRTLVDQYARLQKTSGDWCMVNNFKDAFFPRNISLPPGMAELFKKRMIQFLDIIKKELPKAFSDEVYNENRNKIQKRYKERQMVLFQKAEEFAHERQVMIVKSNTGFKPVSIKDGREMTQEEFRELPEEDKAVIDGNIQLVKDEIESVFREANKIEQGMNEEIDALKGMVALFVVKGRMDTIRADFKDCPEVLSYLDDVRSDIVANIGKFLNNQKSSKKKEGEGVDSNQQFFRRYLVNILVDRKDTTGAPVIFEANPTHQNVFGQIEKRTIMGMISTDYTMVKAGSLLEANGGYLIMEVEAVLSNPMVWDALKRALQNKRLYIEDVPVNAGFGMAALRPSPIPLDVKVILYGSYAVFQMLQDRDPKFNKIFKVRADFDFEVDKNEETINQYVQFIAKVCHQENLMPLMPSGVSAMIEYGERHIAKNNKLSIRFGPIVAMLKESHYWAEKSGAGEIAREHVEKAYTEFRFRHSLYEEKMHANYADNTVKIDVDGAVTGQVNALAVFTVGDISFGRPTRITAETYMGKDGIINVEREVNLSGRTHDKGVLIISGYLGRIFAQKHPLSLSVSVTFEQNYAGVDGDSASSTELYAILSSLSDVPVNQGIAVTGSVNQKGEIQAIGGVNEKIEGFFDVCRTKGLTGSQGVIIPAANVRNLELKQDVIDAVTEGKYHIYSVSHITEGIEILTGAEAGKPNREGDYPKTSIYGKVQQKLWTYLKRSIELKKMAEIDSDREEA